MPSKSKKLSKKLTAKNYYSKDNPYISSSKLKTFIKDKALYKRRYINYEPQEKTDALIIGSAVDTLLTKGNKAFQSEFKVVDRRSSKEEDDRRMQLNPTMHDKVMDIVDSIKRQDIWNDLKRRHWKKQVILKNDELGICGMLDFLQVNGDYAIIVDLKTSNTIDPKKYYWHCYEYDYFLQMAFYKTLVKTNYPEVELVKCYHLVVEKDSDELYDCAVFQFDDEIIDNEAIYMRQQLKELRKEIEFKPKSVGWKDKILILPLS